MRLDVQPLLEERRRQVGVPAPPLEHAPRVQRRDVGAVELQRAAEGLVTVDDHSERAVSSPCTSPSPAAASDTSRALESWPCRRCHCPLTWAEEAQLSGGEAARRGGLTRRSERRPAHRRTQCASRTEWLLATHPPPLPHLHSPSRSPATRSMSEARRRAPGRGSGGRRPPCGGAAAAGWPRPRRGRGEGHCAGRARRDRAPRPCCPASPGSHRPPDTRGGRVLAWGRGGGRGRSAACKR